MPLIGFLASTAAVPEEKSFTFASASMSKIWEVLGRFSRQYIIGSFPFQNCGGRISFSRRYGKLYNLPYFLLHCSVLRIIFIFFRGKRCAGFCSNRRCQKEKPVKMEFCMGKRDGTACRLPCKNEDCFPPYTECYKDKCHMKPRDERFCIGKPTGTKCKVPLWKNKGYHHGVCINNNCEWWIIEYEYIYCMTKKSWTILLQYYIK